MEDDLGPPPDHAPVLRREEFIDVGPQRVRIDYTNDVQSVTFEANVYLVQLDSNNKKFIDINGQRYFKVEQPGLFGQVEGGRRRSRRRRSRRRSRRV